MLASVGYSKRHIRMGYDTADGGRDMTDRSFSCVRRLDLKISLGMFRSDRDVR